MRERLIAAFVGLTVATVAVFAVVRAYSVSDLVEDQQWQQTQRSVVLVAAAVGERVRGGGEVTASFLQRQLSEGERIEYDGGGDVVEAETADFEGGEGADAMLQTTRLVAGGGAVTLWRSTAEVDEQVADAVLEIVLLGIALTIVAAFAGLVAARRLSRPFRDLAGLAAEFGRGRFDVDVDVDVPHYSIPEAEAIGRAMHDAQREVTELLGRERAFAANASHQLKTPITALRIQLEDLALWPQTHPDITVELTSGLAELDRLSATVNELLEHARGRRVGSVDEIDLCAVIADTAKRWRPRVEAAGRKLVALTPGQVAVRLSPGPVTQILDVLIDNAVQHGAGAISVTVAALDTHVRVQVRDQGEQPIADEVFRRKLDVSLLAAAASVQAGSEIRRDGISLSVATEIAEAIGGYLRHEPDPPTTFSLMIPRSRPQA